MTLWMAPCSTGWPAGNPSKKHQSITHCKGHHTSGLTPHTSDLTTSDLKPKTSDFTPHTSHLTPPASHLRPRGPKQSLQSSMGSQELQEAPRVGPKEPQGGSRAPKGP